MEEKKKDLKWYDSGNIITSLIIAIIFIIIICSQSFANGGEVSLTLFSSIINHNSIYLFVLIYFIFLKIPFGKRYFNYFNVFLVFVYFIVTLTSLLTIVQSFSLITALTFTLNFVFLIYLSHTLFRDSRIWKDFHLAQSPFNELKNEHLFYAIVVLTVFLLAVNLISTVVISGVILSLLDAIYYLLLGRYLYLYWNYLDFKKLDVDNEGNFDVVRGKVQNVLDKTEIDEMIIDGAKGVKQKIDELTGKKEVDSSTKIVPDDVVDSSSVVNEKKEEIAKKRKTSTKKEKEKGEE